MAPPNLDSLPVETTDQVASQLDTRKDMFALMRTCKALYFVVSNHKAVCLRHLFKKRGYDLPPGKSLKFIMKELKHRDSVHWGKVIFSLGSNLRIPHMVHNQQEAGHLELARDLIVESYAGLPSPTLTSTTTLDGKSEVQITRHVSQNLKRLQQLVRETNLMDCNKYWDGSLNYGGRPAALLQVVWLLSIQWQLDDTTSRVKTLSPAYNFLFSQQAVYALPPSNNGGLFIDRRSFAVNLNLAVNIANFFKFYFTVGDGHQMCKRFQELDALEKPQAWRHQILQGSQKLGKNWKGSNAYMAQQHVREIRSTGTVGRVYPDIFDGSDEFASLEVDFDHENIPWPQEYEDALESIPPAGLVEKLKRYPSDWIKEQKSAIEMSVNVTEYALKLEALKGDEDSQIELDWRRQSLKLQIPCEMYSAKKGEFISEWQPHTPSPMSSHPDFPLPPPANANGRKKGRGSNRGNRPAQLSPAAQIDKDYYQFGGHGMDRAHKFKVSGNVHGLPPVEDVPGWQRITFMKSYEHDNSLWCYEGVVFPGNMIMVGRWWNKNDNADRLQVGPFIYWNTDP